MVHLLALLYAILKGVSSCSQSHAAPRMELYISVACMLRYTPTRDTIHTPQEDIA